MVETTYYIGLMSGTSADAVDLALVNFGEGKTELLCTHSLPLPSALRKAIHRLAISSPDEIDLMGELDQQLGILFGKAVNELLVKANIKANQILAIGSHGQTIRHRPPGSVTYPFTLQIGDPNIIAQTTGITTVADFRRRDMAAGGHGAPLVPAFHRAIFASNSSDRVILNVGGMANITWLPRLGSVVGFDTGPGNVLMDAWIFENLGKPYDAQGNWATSGTPDLGVINTLLQHSFFKQTPPKSTGREAFNLAWLKQHLDGSDLDAADIQASLLELTAQSIAMEIKKLSNEPIEVFVCGGGAYNQALMASLQRHLPHCTIDNTAHLGIAPEWIEAMAFAWLAKQTMNRQAGNLCAVTGASQEVILGGVYFA